MREMRRSLSLPPSLARGSLEPRGSGPAVQGTDVRFAAEASPERNRPDPMEAVIHTIAVCLNECRRCLTLRTYMYSPQTGNCIIFRRGLKTKNLCKGASRAGWRSSPFCINTTQLRNGTFKWGSAFFACAEAWKEERGIKFSARWNWIGAEGGNSRR